MHQPTSNRYLAQCGLPLLQNGYQIIPITPGYKHPTGLEDWQTLQATPELLNKWLSNGRANDGVGILTTYTPAVDLDVYDAGVAQVMQDWVDQYIGTAPLRVGQAPKRLLVFRTSAPFPKIYSASYIWPGCPVYPDDHPTAASRGKPVPSKVEILGAGQQFVAYAVHPDTGKPYVWDDSGLVATPWAQLDELTPDQARAICQAFEQVADSYVAQGLWTKYRDGNWRTVSDQAYSGPAGSVGFDPLDVKPPRDDVSIEQIRALLQEPGIVARAEDRDNWVKLGAALSHQFGGSDEGRELWEEWSATASNYSGTEDIEYRWSTFKHDKSQRAVTINLLLRWAEEDKAQVVKFRYDALCHKLAGVADYEVFAESPLLNEVRNFLRDNPEFKNDIAATLKSKANAPRIDSLKKAITPAKGVNRKHLTVATGGPNGDPATGTADFEYGENGIIPNQSNVNLAIRQAGYGHFAFDEFQAGILYAPPGAQVWRPLTDNDYPRALVHLEALGFANVAKEKVKDAIAVVAEERTFDSAKLWAQSLVWDGVPRLQTFGATYLGLPNTPYVQAVWLYTWSAMAGRLLDPGCKVDMIPVLVSDEGMRKSTLVEALAPTPEAFGLLDLGAKEDDVSRAMRGKLVMEWAELKGLKGRDEEFIKQFVTRTFQSWTPKYREHEQRFYRRCVFIATTNEIGHLPATGKVRRWLPLLLTQQADVERVRADLFQLWAEAIAWYRQHGVMWEQAERLASPEREQFRETDPLGEAVDVWLSTLTYDSKGAQTERGATPFKMLDVVQALTESGVKNIHPNRIGDRLRKQGYEVRIEWVDGKTQRRWHRGAVG